MKEYEAEVIVRYTFESDCDVGAIVEHGQQLIAVRAALKGVSGYEVRVGKLGRVPRDDGGGDGAF